MDGLCSPYRVHHNITTCFLN